MIFFMKALGSELEPMLRSRYASEIVGIIRACGGQVRAAPVAPVAPAVSGANSSTGAAVSAAAAAATAVTTVAIGGEDKMAVSSQPLQTLTPSQTAVIASTAAGAAVVSAAGTVDAAVAAAATAAASTNPPEVLEAVARVQMVWSLK